MNPTPCAHRLFYLILSALYLLFTLLCPRYERLCLDLDQHLKDPESALESISAGLDDPNVRLARKLSLFQRAAKICGMKRNQTRLGVGPETMESGFKSRRDWMELEDTPKVCIQGRMMAKDNQPGS